MATDVGDIAESVGTTGLIVPRESPQQLADAWQQLLAMTTEERRQRGQMAQTRIRDIYSLDTVIKRYQVIFQSKVAAMAIPSHKS